MVEIKDLEGTLTGLIKREKQHADPNVFTLDKDKDIKKASNDKIEISSTDITYAKNEAWLQEEYEEFENCYYGENLAIFNEHKDFLL